MPTTPSISFMQDGTGRIAARSLDLGRGPEITRYAYDSAGRLARVTDGRGALRESYQYDREARRLADINPLRFRGERRYTYSLGDRLLQAGDAQYAHDPAGFRSLKVAKGRQTQYHYEPSGLLLAVELPDGRRVEYGYDADGLRREKRIDGQPAEAFRWLAPLRLLEFYDGERWWRLAYTQGRTPVGVTDGSASYLLLADQIGTPLALATPDGNVVQTMRYDSFGNPLRGLQGPVRLPLGFAGGLFDADTGLTRFVWRDYDADTGRFTALDPLGEKGGDNDWYGYCLDDPINRADVWGLEEATLYEYDTPPFGHIGISLDDGPIYGKAPDGSQKNEVLRGLWMNVPGVVRQEDTTRVPSRMVSIPISSSQKEAMQDYINKSIHSPQKYHLGNDSCVTYGCSVLKSGGVKAPDGSFIQPRQPIDFYNNSYPDIVSDSWNNDLNIEKTDIKND